MRGFAIRALVVTIAAVIVAFVANRGSARGDSTPDTHLAVPSNQLVHLVIASIPNDNSSGHFFRFDYSGPAFRAVPRGMSFVVTDVFVTPQPQSLEELLELDATDRYTVVINIGSLGSRFIVANFVGASQVHLRLGGGIVAPAGATVSARNTTSSKHAVQVQLLGYLIKGAGLPENTAPF